MELLILEGGDGSFFDDQSLDDSGQETGEIGPVSSAKRLKMAISTLTYILFSEPE